MQVLLSFYYMILFNIKNKYKFCKKSGNFKRYMI